MNLTELEQLAKGAANEPAPYARAGYQEQFRRAANPETILRMIAAIRQAAEALEICDRMLPEYYQWLDEALTALRELEEGK